jgi:Spy/CpxP family protein refolding chaperone
MGERQYYSELYQTFKKTKPLPAVVEKAAPKLDYGTSDFGAEWGPKIEASIRNGTPLPEPTSLNDMIRFTALKKHIVSQINAPATTTPATTAPVTPPTTSAGSIGEGKIGGDFGMKLTEAQGAQISKDIQERMEEDKKKAEKAASDKAIAAAQKLADESKAKQAEAKTQAAAEYDKLPKLKTAKNSNELYAILAPYQTSNPALYNALWDMAYPQMLENQEAAKKATSATKVSKQLAAKGKTLEEMF